MSRRSDIGVDQIMLVMDGVDTLTHVEGIVDGELSGDECRMALKEKLRSVYRQQGVEVSDDILDKAISALEEQRFVYRPLKPGFKRTIAKAYVNRNKYFLRGAIALAASAIVVYTFDKIEHSLVEKRRKAAEETILLLRENLPRELERAVASATLAAREITDGEALMNDVERLRLDARAALASSDVDGARKAIDGIDAIRKEMEDRISTRRMASEAGALIDEARAVAKDFAAMKAIEAAAVDLERAAKGGRRGSFETAKAKFVALMDEIRLPLIIRIVDRPGEMSGIWRVRDDDPRTKVHYLVVEAVRPDGTTVPRRIHNVETDRIETVTKWAIRVPESVYRKVADDKKSDGLINDRDVGVKPAGALDISWTVETTGQTITQW